MKNLSRSTALKIAAVISLLFGLWVLVATLPMVLRGPDPATLANETPPFIIVVISLVLGVVQVVAAYGVWMQQRWGIVLTIITNVLNALAAAPGILFAPTTQLFIEATVGIIVNILVIVLCLWRDRKLATA